MALYARTRITLVQTAAVALAFAAVLATVAVSVTAVVSDKDEALYRERLAGVLARVESEHAGLAKNGLDGVDAYVENAKKAVADDLAKKAAAGDRVFLAVVDEHGNVVVHPKLAPGAKDLAGAAWVKALQAKPDAASLVADDVDGERAWLAHARFAPWRWDVVYVVPMAVKYAPVRALATRVLLLAVVGLAVVIAVTAVGARRIGRTVRAVVSEATRLRDAVADGRLSVRGDAAAIEAEFRPIVEGFNATMDAFERPIRITADYATRISKGDVPPKIVETYRGDFDVIREALNRCIDAVNAVVADAKRLASAGVEGRLSTRADAARHEGEFRAIVEGVNGALDAFTTPVSDAARVLERLAQRDLTARVTAEYRGDYARLKEAINATGLALEQALAQVATAVQQVASAAGQIAGASQQVADGASRQASALAHTTTRLETIGGVTRTSAENARAADALARSAAEAAGQGMHAVTEMSGAMGRIRAAAEGTAQIIKDINEIAFQTNLLALNAAVEAARAGDAGRGFAVVAEEVRTLALRSKEAANRTESLIRESVKQTEDGESTSRVVNGRLSEIGAAIGKMTAIVSELAEAARHQSEGIEEISGSMSQVDGVTQANAAHSEQSSSAAQELSGQAEELAAMIASFRIAQERRAS